MKAYLDIVDRIIKEGQYKPNRTGIGAYTVAGAMFQHNMQDGFPLLTTKQMPFKTLSVELEFFIKGLTDKKWLQDRKCHIWDEWASPAIINEQFEVNPELNAFLVSIINRYKKYYTSENGEIKFSTKSQNAINELKSSGYINNVEKILSKEKLDSEDILFNNLDHIQGAELEKKLKGLAQLLERDLGPVYGWQWRRWGAEYKNYKTDYTGEGIDQLEKIVKTLKTNPTDRRMIATAWQPKDLPKMALPACHYSFQVTVVNDKLNLLWNQRSVDTMLGLPFNIASYGLLLHLLAKESSFKEGTLTGFLADVHIYENQVEGAKEQLSRDFNKYKLPQIETKNFKSIFDWQYSDTELKNYESYPKVDFGKVAV